MMTLRQFVVLCTFAVPLLFSQNTLASLVQYDYVGNPFVNNDATNPQCLLGDTGCFTNISASFQLATALGSNTALQNITPLAWSISDGMTTITNLDAGYYLFRLQVQTDASGNISGWDYITAINTVQPDAITSIRSVFNTGYGTSDETNYCRSVSGSSCVYNAQASVLNSPGSWIVSTVPVPAAAWLFGSGLLGLIGIARRKA